MMTSTFARTCDFGYEAWPKKNVKATEPKEVQELLGRKTITPVPTHMRFRTHEGNL
jgi:hypothetical protein